MLRDFLVAVVYVHVPKDINHIKLGQRFAASYRQNPPGISSHTVIVCNGSNPTKHTHELFDFMSPQYLIHDDSGWDIGAYQKAAREVPADLMVFFGGSTWFAKPGWLARMAESFIKHGNAIYGAMGNRGAGKVQPHIRTTGFWLPPAILNRYPTIVTQRAKFGQRYEFEHGKDCLTGWVTRQGLKALVVSWDGEYEWADWDSIPNGFHKGDQSNLLVRDRLTDPPYYQ